MTVQLKPSTSGPAARLGSLPRLPLVAGVPVYMYPSPLHYRTVAELIYAVNATIDPNTIRYPNPKIDLSEMADHCSPRNKIPYQKVKKVTVVTDSSFEIKY